jgi:hypothetical protein
VIYHCVYTLLFKSDELAFVEFQNLIKTIDILVLEEAAQNQPQKNFYLLNPFKMATFIQ